MWKFIFLLCPTGFINFVPITAVKCMKFKMQKKILENKIVLLRNRFKPIDCEVVRWKWNTNKISQEVYESSLGISYVWSNPIRNIINDPCFSIRTYYVIKETLTLRKYDIVMIIHMLDHVWIDIVCNLILQLFHIGAFCQYFVQWQF